MMRRYRQNYMKTTAETFCKWVLELSDADSVSKSQRHQKCAVPASFCAMRYIKDRRYLTGDENSMQTWRLRPKEANVELRAAAVKSTEKYRKQQALQIFTLRNIKVGVELIVEYSIEYSFEKSDMKGHCKNIIKQRTGKSGCMKAMIVPDT